jgi:tetratricopeptide (TPR) repeat protein
MLSFPAALTFIFLFSACCALSACGPKVVRVPVTPENRQRANELVREGDLVFARREYYPALIKYTEASKLNPNSEIIFNKMGISYSALGYYGEAEFVLRRALELNRKFVFAYNNLGTVYFAQGDMSRAQKLFRQAINQEPKVASFHVNLGQTLLEDGKYEKGMEEIRKGLALDPNILDRDQTVIVSASRGKPSPEKSYHLARIYAAAGDVDKAIKYLRDAIDAGFRHLDWVDSEQDFDSVRGNEKFALFLSEARIKYRTVSPPVAPPP